MRVLLVEDDAAIADAVARGLSAEGFSVEVAADGDDGFWRATEGSFDAVVLDIMLPGRNGFRVCADLRTADVWTPVLVLTAKDGEFDQAEALDTGADAYLTKPFSFPVLVATLRALLRRASERVPVPVEVGGVRIDQGRRRVWRDEEEVALTTREFDVLQFLLRREDQVLSKDAILAGVWGPDFEGDPNIVEVYVGRIRRKLTGPNDRHRIETLRGAGYRFTTATGGRRS